ncbi:Archease protein family (MTH1598/TM1083) [Micromonospora haikouensis]|uniref:Archease protein family (MTH1598/TM1083) n=1 Tax=Micromonospora haikouensis TaxID=686309 RepID=A0A1C4U417_9ACTN|nr:archease [Micromonospora haikouensis]SCE66445.1 Archease protein family (MTH1598/TM1083) [Micromonospora haikouensis]
MRSGSGRGRRSVAHTADVRIEAWAPDREGCVAEAVAAMVETFADTTGAVELVGAVPKAVALQELRFGPGPRGWSCAVTLDV